MALTYRVSVGNIYGIPSLKSEMEVYVGTSSTNHKATIAKEVKKHFGDSAVVTNCTKSHPTMRFNFGIGKPQSYQDK